MLGAVVVGATKARVEDETCEVTLYHCGDVAAATADDLDAVRGEFVQCAVAHIAYQHNTYAHLLKFGSDARLAAATLRRGQIFAADNLLAIYSKYGIVVTMSKVVIDLSVTRRNG